MNENATGLRRDPPAPSDTAPGEAALRRVLTPLLRFALRTGLRLEGLVDMIKGLLVEIAEEDLAEGARAPTDSRISLVTGVHRKDVRARRRGAPAGCPEPRSLLATVIGRWAGDPGLQDERGRPAPLTRDRFDALVSEITSDVRPRTVLDELARLGAVRADEDGALHLVEAALTPDDAQALALFGANLGDHAEAAVENLSAPKGASRRLERAVFYNRLREDDVAALQALARAEGQALLERLNRVALERQRAASGDQAAAWRFRFGIYFFDARPGEAREPAADPEGDRS